jgi:hypothetical protein
MIFLSFYEASEDSWEIIQQLTAFFSDWNLIPCVVRDNDGTEPPKEKMRSSLIKSRFLLQLFTNHENTRKWMFWEWETFVTAKQTSGLSHEKPIVLYTTETDMNDESFRLLKLAIDEGTVKACKINNDSEVRSLLGGILGKTGQLRENRHGRFELPPFCQPAVATEQMTWDVVEGFIRNFRGASMKGLERFYADREELIPDLKKRLQDEKGLVRMVGFTLRDYLLHPEPGSADSVDLGSVFELAVEKGANAKLLLLNRDCEAAKERARIETPDKTYEESLFYTNSCKVSNYYEGKERVRIQYYDTPYIGLILFEDEAYVEIYHLGKRHPDKDICGRVPILGVKRRNEPGLYELFDRHFNSVWNPDEDRLAVSKSIVPPSPLAPSVPKQRHVDHKKNLRLRRRSIA